MNAKRKIFSLFMLVLLSMSACKAKLSPSTLHEGTGVLSFEGFDIQYTIKGSGPPVLVVFHGELFLKALSTSLLASYNWVMLDFRSQADATPDAITMEALTSAIHETQETLGLEKSLILGHSLPGVLALEYALRYPKQCAGLVLIAVPPSITKDYFDARQSFWSQSASPERKMLFEQATAQLLTNPPQDVTGLFDKYVLFAPIYWFEPAFAPTTLFSEMHTDKTLEQQLIDQVFSNYSPADGLKNLSMPVFLALGRYDFNLPYSFWEEPASQVKNIQVVIFEQSGHFPMIEEPEAFENSLNQWIEAHFELPDSQP